MKSKELLLAATAMMAMGAHTQFEEPIMIEPRPDIGYRPKRYASYRSYRSGRSIGNSQRKRRKHNRQNPHSKKYR